MSGLPPTPTDRRREKRALDLITGMVGDWPNFSTGGLWDGTQARDALETYLTEAFDIVNEPQPTTTNDDLLKWLKWAMSMIKAMHTMSDVSDDDWARITGIMEQAEATMTAAEGTDK